ncbi:MAG: sensor protein [Proteobacteria bacterium]|nr:sensor protein [Pseudomonadota bacterium]
MTSSDPTPRQTILVVDDQPENIELLSAALKEHYRIKFALSGGNALRIINSENKPDLVLLDIMMPDMDGYAVCSCIKANPATQDIPVIFVTAMGEIEDEQHGLEAGAVDYITKPVSQPIVVARVKAHLALKNAADAQRHVQAQLQASNAELTAALNSLEIAHEELMRTEKLASLGALVAGVTHELNSPISNALIVATTIQAQSNDFRSALDKGITRSMLENYVQETASAADLVARNLQRAAELTGSFKHVSADQTSSQRRRFQLEEVVVEIILTLKPSIKKTPFQIEHHVEKNIYMDSFPGPLGQVITNLINNAIMHAFEDRTQGTVRLLAKSAEADTVELQVSDDGRGIPPANLEKIFDPFFTTRLGRGGSGLGLNIVKSIVTRVLGGKIEVHSTLNQGTTFTISLPCRAPIPEA